MGRRDPLRGPLHTTEIVLGEACWHLGGNSQPGHALLGLVRAGAIQVVHPVARPFGADPGTDDEIRAHGCRRRLARHAVRDPSQREDDHHRPPRLHPLPPLRASTPAGHPSSGMSPARDSARATLRVLHCPRCCLRRVRTDLECHAGENVKGIELTPSRDVIWRGPTPDGTPDVMDVAVSRTLRPRHLSPRRRHPADGGRTRVPRAKQLLRRDVHGGRVRPPPGLGLPRRNGSSSITA